MQPPCSLRLGPPPSPGSQGAAAAGLQRLEEKRLFEKFWKGTFKAVATPRPESVIVASITARRRVTASDTTACQPLKTDEREAADARVDAAAAAVAAADRNGCIKGKGRKRRGHRRVRSPSLDDDLSPRPKGKKKKRKSERKRKRKRSPSRSLSPLRKKKKKKKKRSSKKSKRHRYTSKKSKHSSSSLKHKRKDERKHKKSSRTHSRRRRRYRRSDSSSCQSSAEDRHHLQKSALGEEMDGGLHHADVKWRPATKSVCKTARKYRSILSTATVLSSKPGSELLPGKGPRHFPSQAEGPRDYDSGNDTSSPPSSKTGVSRASAAAADGKRSQCRRLASPGKLKFADRDNASDSGNSVTSYASLCRPYGEDGLSAALFAGNSKREQITLGCRVEVVRAAKASRRSRRTSGSSRRRRQRRPKTRSSSGRSRSRSRSSGSSRYSGRYSRSPSLSTCSSYSRSPSYSSSLRRRGSVASLSSRGSYSRHSADRLRDRKRAPSYRETDAPKVSGKRRRRKSYSPMKKRRRDSPSHLEARRITSARKRPIPYFRPSPSSSSRCTSVSSWSSLFTRTHSPIRSISRSRTRSRTRSRSRSRSHGSSSSSSSSSSYRSYSRSSSWNSIFGTRSRSRSSSRRGRTRH